MEDQYANEKHHENDPDLGQNKDGVGDRDGVHDVRG